MEPTFVDVTTNCTNKYVNEMMPNKVARPITSPWWLDGSRKT